MRRVLVLIALSLFGCSKKSYKIPSGSMIPTIGFDQHFIADTSVKKPERGDVFVFQFPEHPEQKFVKRVIGLSGERVEVKGHVVLIDGKALPTCSVGGFAYDADGTKHQGELVLEKAGANAYLVVYEVGQQITDGAWSVTTGAYFMLGDNRLNSHDSRMWFGGNGGSVPPSMLEGKVEVPKLALPKGAEGLAGALAKCKAELGV